MYMLDTNICICAINERDEALREPFEAHAAEICISSITYAELCYGVANSERVGENRRVLEAFCHDLAILQFGVDAAAYYGEIRHALRQSGMPIGANDLFIAAHARSLEATLVTNDQGEFERVPELRVENWSRS